MVNPSTAPGASPTKTRASAPASPAPLVVFTWNSAEQTEALLAAMGDTGSISAIIAPVAPPSDTLSAETRILEGVPHDAEGSVSLRSYSLPGLHSLVAPLPVLFDLYPALTERAPIEVPSLSPDALRSAIAALGDRLRLVVDMPGLEGDLIALLVRCRLLDRVEALTLRAMAEPCFEGSFSATALIDALAEAGLTLLSRDDSDPDWPILTFGADLVARRLQALEAERDALAVKLSRRDGALAEKTAEAARLSTRQSELEAELASRTAALQRSKAEITEKSTALEAAQAANAEAKVRLAELRKAKDAGEQRRAELSEALNQRTRALTESQQALEAANKARETVERERQTLQETLAQRDTDLAAGKAKATELTAALTQAREAQAALQQDRDRIKAALDQRALALTESQQALEVANKASEAVKRERQALQDTLAQRDTALAAEKAKATDLTTALSQAREAQASLRQDRDQIKAALAEGEAEQARLRQALEAAGQEKSASDGILKKLRSEQADAATAHDRIRVTLAERDLRLAELERLATEQRQALDRLHEAMARLETDRDETRADLRLAIESANAAHADHDALRQRFTALSDERDQLIDLLQSLTPRLREAAEHLRQLPSPDEAEGDQDEDEPAQRHKPKRKTKRKSE